MSLGNTFELDILKLILNAAAIANVADNASSSPLTNLYISLHTADPGEAGDQTTSEATYTGYARVAVVRTTSGFTAANPSTNVAVITFPACTGGSNTITHAMIGTASSGAGKKIIDGAVSPNLAVSNGITPSIAIGALSFALD
jgi:hypothetical protein